MEKVVNSKLFIRETCMVKMVKKLLMNWDQNTKWR